MIKTAFILGGHGDIGSAITERFKKEGFKVIAPRSSEFDLSDRRKIEIYLDNLKLNFVDVIVHCAGINNPKPVEQVTLDDINQTYAVNTLGFFQVIKHFLSGFKKNKKGYILAISSIYSVISRAERLPYSMSKHALNGLIKTLAIELGPYNVKVNALSPGYVDTKLTRKNNSPEIISSFEKNIPLGKLGSTQDIASVAYFLCTSENNYISGQNIIVDGGYMAGGFQK